MQTTNPIIAARQKLGLKQPAFARELGVNQSSISRWENGEAPVPEWAEKAVERLLKERERAA